MPAGEIFDTSFSFLSFAWALASLLDINEIREATNYINTLDEEDKSIIHTWLVFEGLSRIAYYLLVFLAVFLLGRRIIQAVIAGYREARAQSF